MGMRPPTDDTSEPDAIEFGIAAVAARLDDSAVSFPATGDEIVDELGDPEIPYDVSGHTIALSDAVAETPTRRFEDEQELLNALHPVFEEHRGSGSVGLVQQVRAMLPF